MGFLTAVAVAATLANPADSRSTASDVQGPPRTISAAELSPQEVLVMDFLLTDDEKHFREGTPSVLRDAMESAGSQSPPSPTLTVTPGERLRDKVLGLLTGKIPAVSPAEQKIVLLVISTSLVLPQGEPCTTQALNGLLRSPATQGQQTLDPTCKKKVIVKTAAELTKRTKAILAARGISIADTLFANPHLPADESFERLKTTAHKKGYEAVKVGLMQELSEAITNATPISKLRKTAIAFGPTESLCAAVQIIDKNQALFTYGSNGILVWLKSHNDSFYVGTTLDRLKAGAVVVTGVKTYTNPLGTTSQAFVVEPAW